MVGSVASSAFFFRLLGIVEMSTVNTDHFYHQKKTDEIVGRLSFQSSRS
jgi:hypothetical protein